MCVYGRDTTRGDLCPTARSLCRRAASAPRNTPRRTDGTYRTCVHRTANHDGHATKYHRGAPVRHPRCIPETLPREGPPTVPPDAARAVGRRGGLDTRGAVRPGLCRRMCGAACPRTDSAQSRHAVGTCGLRPSRGRWTTSDDAVMRTPPADEDIPGQRGRSWTAPRTDGQRDASEYLVARARTRHRRSAHAGRPCRHETTALSRIHSALYDL